MHVCAVRMGGRGAITEDPVSLTLAPAEARGAQRRMMGVVRTSKTRNFHGYQEEEDRKGVCVSREP